MWIQGTGPCYAGPWPPVKALLEAADGDDDGLLLWGTTDVLNKTGNSVLRDAAYSLLYLQNFIRFTAEL